MWCNEIETIHFRVGEQVLHLCCNCIQERLLRTVYDRAIPHIIRLQANGELDTALTLLSFFMDAYNGTPEFTAIKYDLSKHIARIRAAQGYPDTAISMLSALQTELLGDSLGYQGNQIELAKVLQQVGRVDEAIAACILGLDQAKAAVEGITLELLLLYSQLCAQQSQVIPQHIRSAYNAIFAWAGVKVVPFASDPNSFAFAIQFLMSELDLGNDRYSALVASLPSSMSDPNATSQTIAQLQEYIANEAVGFFRQLAQQRLRTIQPIPEVEPMKPEAAG